MTYAAIFTSHQRPFFVVSADRWVDARAYIRKRFGDPDADAKPTIARPDAELRWVGHDAGSAPNLRMEARDLPGGEWGTV